jgi:RHS repeat-associated protein
MDQDGNPTSDLVADHAQFRDYSLIQGRWLSPDPYDGSYDFTNPQSLNRYSYSLNNPLGYVDGKINHIAFNSQNQGIGYSSSAGDGSAVSDRDRQFIRWPRYKPRERLFSNRVWKIQPSSGTPLMRAVPKLTTGQIYSLCALAVSLAARGTVPGGSTSGTASPWPSEGTPLTHMPVPGKSGLAFIPMNEDAAKVENPVAGLALVGSLGECVNAVPKANQ